MQKIVFIASNVDGGGAQRVVLTLIKHLDLKKFLPILLLLDGGGDYIDEIPKSIKVVSLKANRARYAGPELYYFLWKSKPDIIFSTLGYMNILTMIVCRFLHHRPKVIVREVFPVKQEFQYARFLKTSQAFRKLLYKNVDKIICQSDSIRNDLVQSYNLPDDKVVRIYNPVDVKGIREKAIATPNPYSGNSRNIVAMGRLNYQKGFDLLIRAIAQVTREHSDIQLTILGKGKNKKKLQRLASELNIEARVTFSGFIKNPYPYLKYADLFVLSSRFEGLSNALLEALACGVTIVATDAPGGTTDVIEDAVNGWLVKSEDIGALADGIKIALSNPLTLTGNRLLEHVENQFGIQTIISQYEAVFQ